MSGRYFGDIILYTQKGKTRRPNGRWGVYFPENGTSPVLGKPGRGKVLGSAVHMKQYGMGFVFRTRRPHVLPLRSGVFVNVQESEARQAGLAGKRYPPGGAASPVHLLEEG